MIAFNAVFQFISDSKRIRILDLDRNFDKCFFIFIDGDKCMPQLENLSTLDAFLESNELLEIIDPYYDSRLH